MRHALLLPAFDALADPRTVVDIAVRAEASGWDGLFLWDHLTYRAPVVEVADPWVVLAAVAFATERIRIGTMVTPLPRRRPQVVARQAATLDHLSGGRTVLGVGTGDDEGREYTGFADTGDPAQRGAMLDEEVAILRALWTGENVTIHGEYHVVDDARFLPRPVQHPHLPVWASAPAGARAQLLSAARHDGVFPIGLERPEDLRALLAALGPRPQDHATPFDVCVNLVEGTDPDEWEAAGATWLTTHVGPFHLDAADVRRMAESPPPAWSRVDGWA